MYYRIDRTYLTNAAGQSEQSQDSRPYLVAGATSHDAAMAFIRQEDARLLGSVSVLPGDKALATASSAGRLYVLFIQRGVEALPLNVGEDTAKIIKRPDEEAVRRTGGESSDIRPRSPHR